MNLKKITGEQLDLFYKSYPEKKTFLQTSAYGRFREQMGEKNLRYGIFKNSQIIGIAQFQVVPAKRSRHLHCPHGPLLKKEYLPEALPFFLSKYKEIGKENRCDFVRISSLLEPGKKDFFEQEKYRPAPVHLVNPEKTWVLDLTTNEDEIKKQMKKSTRYEINRIEKNHIQVQKGNGPEDLDIFWALHQKTVQRHGFVPFSKKSTQKELDILGDQVQIFSASLDDEFFASSVIIFDSHAGYYHQGASVPHKLPFSYATLWAAIQEAQKRGCREFNFWGVCDKDDKNHPWYGLSKFKRGFGGEEQNFLHAQDYPLTPKYALNWIIEKYRKWKRRY